MSSEKMNPSRREQQEAKRRSREQGGNYTTHLRAVRRENEEILAQVIHDSFYAMQAGEDPEPGISGSPNSGDLQLAHDILRNGYVKFENTRNVRPIR
jgi:hypothetical protein